MFKVFEHPNLVKDIPAHGRGLELDDLEMSLPTQFILYVSKMDMEEIG